MCTAEGVRMPVDSGGGREGSRVVEEKRGC